MDPAGDPACRYLPSVVRVCAVSRRDEAMTEPRTEAGRARRELTAYLDALDADLTMPLVEDWLDAIEAEARSQGLEAARAVIEPAVERAEASRRVEASADCDEVRDAYTNMTSKALALREALGAALDFIISKTKRPSDEYAQAWAPLARALANTAQAAAEAEARLLAPWREALRDVRVKPWLETPRDIVDLTDDDSPCWCPDWLQGPAHTPACDHARALLDEAER